MTWGMGGWLEGGYHVTSERWSEQLVRTRLSAELVDEAISESNGGIDDDTAAALRGEISDKRQLKQLKKLVKPLRASLSEDVYYALREEIDEIAEDFGWEKSSQAKRVIAVNDWWQPFHQDFRSKSEFDDVMVGSHATKNVVMITGKVASEADLESLVAYVASKHPPRKLLIDVGVNP